MRLQELIVFLGDRLTAMKKRRKSGPAAEHWIVEITDPETVEKGFVAYDLYTALEAAVKYVKKQAMEKQFKLEYPEIKEGEKDEGTINNRNADCETRELPDGHQEIANRQGSDMDNQYK